MQDQDQDQRGIPMERDAAWRMFDGWKHSGREIGIVFWGRSGNLYTMGRVEAAHDGRLALTGDGVRVSFQLRDVEFRYGPMQTWPRWPSPPIVEVMALRVEFANGDYLALAEGLRPESLPPLSLPAA